MDNKNHDTMEMRHEARQERQLTLARDPANLRYSSSHDRAREEMRTIQEALSTGMAQFKMNLAQARAEGPKFNDSPLK